MKYEAVIFDWAGTTVDYGCFAPVQAFIDAFKASGIEPTVEEVRGPMGMLKIDHIRTMLKGERIAGLLVQPELHRKYRKAISIYDFPQYGRAETFRCT